MTDFSQGLWIKFLRLKVSVLMILATEDAVVDNAATERVFDRLSSTPKALFRVPGKQGLQFDATDTVNEHLVRRILGLLADTATRSTEA